MRVKKNSFVLEFCLFAVVGGMLCKSDKPSIIIIITHEGLKNWTTH